MKDRLKALHNQRLAEYSANSAPLEPPLLVTAGKTIELFTPQKPLTPQERRHLGENYTLP